MMADLTVVRMGPWPVAVFQSPQWKRVWPWLLSVMAHGMVAAAFLLTFSGPARPPLPQIELLPPAPVPPTPEEAKVSPQTGPQKPIPALAKAVTQPPATETLHALTTTQVKAKAILPVSHKKLRLPKLPQTLASPVVLKTVDHAKTDPAAIPISGAAKALHAVEGDPSTAAVPAGPPPDYIGLIRGRLEKYKRYPAEARAEHQEGVVTLSFVLDRSGRVTEWHIVGSSGFAALDQETAELIQRASPFPPFPSSMDRDNMHLTVPIEFFLKTIQSE